VKNVVVAGEVLAVADVGSYSEASEIDAELVMTIGGITRSVSALGKLIVRMKDKRLWKFLRDPDNNQPFKSWEQYAKLRLGSISHTRLAELSLVASLSEGPFALSEATVNAIGHKRAAELAKVPAEERINLVTSALESTPEQFAVDLQEAKNKGKPIEEQKEAVVLFARNYPVSLVTRFKDLEQRALYMEQFHDADKSISAEAKFLYALVIFFEAGNAEELQAADKRRKAAEKQAIKLREKTTKAS
jgi:hypothetical protein